MGKADFVPGVLARLGVPAHSISTTPIDVDEDYHQVSDEVETLDFAHLTNTVRAIARAAETVVSGEATPTRVAPEAGIAVVVSLDGLPIKKTYSCINR